MLTRACAANIENPVDITHAEEREAKEAAEEAVEEEEEKKPKKQQHTYVRTTTVSRDGSVGELIKSVLWLFKCHVVSCTVNR